uniref:hypothetical protein n=1 Tax=Amycolatopsis sp. CA-293810 TaxID=3239926 RepID=UPI003F49145C
MSADIGGTARPQRVEDLPKYRGLPVPYLVPWDGEAGHEPAIRVSLTGGVWRVAFTDERPGDRDERSVLWYRNEPRADDEDLVALPPHGPRPRTTPTGLYAAPGVSGLRPRP